ncbi:MAG: DUF4428 domain-containing protein [Oscillospiraceae bacterium]|nr:DUF4428 domain-containing protein [Oscillospiraceae bacterium]
MGLFDKKFCDACGEKIGLLGNRKLDDGNICSKCAKKLSPFATDRRRTALAEIKKHLEYREANKAEVAAFRVTRELGGWTKVLIDDSAGKFIVTSSNRWQNDNPDVINLSQISGCRTNVEESRTEILTKDKDGKMVRQFPRQYKVELDYKVAIDVNSPYFSEIEFKLNTMRVDSTSRECRELERQLDEIKQALNNARSAAQPVAAPYAPAHAPAHAPVTTSAPAPAPATTSVPTPAPASASVSSPVAAAAAATAATASTAVAAPTGPRVCPNCGAAASSSNAKFCESCGGAMQ